MRDQLERELARLRGDDPFAALGLGYDADDRAVRAAFLAATKRLHPNRFARHGAETRTLANEVFLRVRDAYAAIAGAEGRDKALARLGRAPAPAAVPQRTVGQGSGSFSVPGAVPSVSIGSAAPPPSSIPRGAPTPPTGVPIVRVATPTPPVGGPAVPPAAARPARAPTIEDLRRQAFAREDDFDTAVKRLEQGFFEVARREFHRLAVDDPGEKKYRVWMHHAKGREHQAAGRAEEARAEYQRALELDPGFAAARQSLAELSGGGDRPAGGLYRRPFGK